MNALSRIATQTAAVPDSPVHIEREAPPIAPLPTEVVGIKEILPIVGVCERHLRELVQRGVIPVVRLPYTNKLLFHVATVRAAVRRYQTGQNLENLQPVA